MSYYVEIELDIYDHGPTTMGVGSYRSYEKANATAKNIDARLRRGKAKEDLDEIYGDDGYSLTVLALRLRTPSQAIAELTRGHLG
jgi:hypothetical protein